MSQELTQFIDIIKSGRTLTTDDVAMVKNLIKEYPFFILPAANMLKDCELDSETTAWLKVQIALNTGDGESLLRLIDTDGQKMANFYPVQEAPETPSTEKAIDTFLDNYGNIDERESKLLERLIFNPVPDYSQVLAREAQEADEPKQPLSEQDALLDAFLENHDAAVRRAEEEFAETIDDDTEPIIKPQVDSSLNESLAKMYIKQQRYDKAYEIIHQLSLNFPKKSIYFADQLRFLQKLMLNQSYSGGKRNK